MFFEQTQIFQEGLSNRHVFSRKTCLSNQGGIFLPPWSNRPHYLMEQILIFKETLLFSPQTHTNFPRASIFSQTDNTRRN